MPAKLSIRRHFPNTLGKDIKDDLAVDPSLKCATSNGCITFCSRTGEDGPAVIVKVQIKSAAADDIIFDILNGWILNECARGADGRHFTRYLGSGWVYVAFRDEKPYRLVGDSVVAGKGREVDAKKHPFCATNAVPGATSLAAMLHPNVSSAEERQIYSMVRGLMKVVTRLGQKHGLTHNDMHTDNVLYDRDNRCFVLIDYGRMLFDGSTVDNGGVLALMRRFKKESWFGGGGGGRGGGEKSYMRVVQHVLRHHKCRMIDLYRVEEPWFLKHLYMFDIMALSLGMMYDLKNKLVRRLDDLKEFFELQEHWRERRSDGQLMLSKLEYRVLHPEVWSTDGGKGVKGGNSTFEKTVRPGVYWFALLLQYLFESDAAKYGVDVSLKGNERWLTVDMFGLTRRKVMFAFGTMISVPEPERFCAFLVEHKDHVQEFCECL